MLSINCMNHRLIQNQFATSSGLMDCPSTEGRNASYPTLYPVTTFCFGKSYHKPIKNNPLHYFLFGHSDVIIYVSIFIYFREGVLLNKYSHITSALSNPPE